MMSVCFTWFPFGGLGEPNIYHQTVCFTRSWEFTWRVSDCEELVGSNHRRRWIIPVPFHVRFPLVQALSQLLDIVDVLAHLTYSFLYSVNLAVHPVLHRNGLNSFHHYPMPQQ